MSTDLKSTALEQIHIALGAKMVPFAGYNMPVQYSGLRQEHAAVRERAGMFDVSHMGEFFVEGPDAIPFLQKVTSNDVSKLIPGKIQYSCFPNEQGGFYERKIDTDNAVIYDIFLQGISYVNELLKNESKKLKNESDKKAAELKLPKLKK